MFLLLCATLVLLLAPALAYAAYLENPRNGALYSGIGVVSGWKCSTNGPLTVRFNGGAPVSLSYGNERGDTRPGCGDTNNGFVSIINWGLLGDGTHTAVVYDNGEEFARSTFTVVTLGEEFVRDAPAAECTVSDFPHAGGSATFRWNESGQNMELVAYEAGEDDEDDETGGDDEDDETGGDDEAAMCKSRPQGRRIPNTGPHKVYWLDLEQSEVYRIERANLDGSQAENLFTSPMIRTEPLDIFEGKLYIAGNFSGGGINHGEHVIQRMNLDGSQLETLVNYRFDADGDLRGVLAAAISKTERKLYWVQDSEHGWGPRPVFRSNLDGSQPEHVTTIDSSNDVLYDVLALGYGRGTICWAATERGETVRVRCRPLDGSNDDATIAAYHHSRGERNASIRIDETSGKVYWLFSYPYEDAPAGWIYRFNLDGSQFEQLVAGYGHITGGPALDEVGGEMYWVTSEGFFRANLDGSAAARVLRRPLNVGTPPSGLLFEAASDSLYTTSLDWQRPRGIHKFPLNGSQVSPILKQWTLLYNRNDSPPLEVDEYEGRIYWVEHHAYFTDPADWRSGFYLPEIYSVDIDGGTRVPLSAINARYDLTNTDGEHRIVDLLVDSQRCAIYWIDHYRTIGEGLSRGGWGQTVWKARLDGTSARRVYSSESDGTYHTNQDIRFLANDRGRVGWLVQKSAGSESALHYAPPGGTPAPRVLWPAGEMSRKITDLEVDQATGSLYWSDDNSLIWVGGREGTEARRHTYAGQNKRVTDIFVHKSVPWHLVDNAIIWGQEAGNWSPIVSSKHPRRIGAFDISESLSP